MSRSRVQIGMDLMATLAAVTGCVLLLWLNWAKIFPPGPRLPPAPVSLQGATLRGSGTAPVVLIEYSDYGCPYCAKADAEILPTISKQYIETGKVQFAFRHHPMEKLHPGATRAAAAALCAGKEGQFWEMHAALFRNPKKLDDASLVAAAKGIGLEEHGFRTCLDGPVAHEVQKDLREAEALGLSGTPAFLVGRREPDGRVRVSVVIPGTRPTSEFAAAIDRALEAPTSVATVVGLVASGATAMGAGLWFGVRGRRTKGGGQTRSRT